MASTAIPTVKIIPAMPGKVKVASNNVKIPINISKLDIKAMHPISKEEIEVWVANFVLMDYGSGAEPGCYFVLPVLGPTTVRDSVGSLINFSGGNAWYNVTVVNDTQYFSEADYYVSRLMDGIDFRAKNLESFDSLENSSVDLYASVRSLYLQDRYRKVKNIDKTTETLSDDDWEELDSQ